MIFNTKFSQVWQQLGIGQQAVLVAVSGGVDSMVLLDLLQKLPGELQPKINVVAVDHCLRAESQLEISYLREYCQQHGLKFYTCKWLPKQHPQTGVEEAGRLFRYSFFAKVMAENQLRYLLTAHHADDQAETFLMKLIRGGDLRQLRGILLQRPFAKHSFLIRPLLNFSKEQLYDYAHQLGLQYFEDATNQTDDYLRNRLRHQVVPVLKKEESQLLRHIAQYQQQLGELLELADQRVAQLLAAAQVSDGYRLASWLDKSPVQKKAMLRKLSATEVSTVNEAQITAMTKLLENEQRPQATIDLKGAAVFVKDYSVFRFESKRHSSGDLQKIIKLSVGRWSFLSPTEEIGLFPAAQVELKNSDDVLEVGALDSPLLLRHRQPGDRLLTAAGQQKVKKILIDHKVPNVQRAKIWLVCKASNEVLWVIGHKKSDLSRPSVNDKIHYIVIYRKIK